MSDTEVLDISNGKPSTSVANGAVERKTAIFKRDSILSELTRLMNYANSHKNGSLELVQVRLELLNEIRTRFLAAHLDCEMSAQSAEEINAENSIRVTFEDDYIDAVVLYKKLLAALTSESSASENANTETVQATESQKLDLPKFSGQYEDWISFKNSFAQVTKEYFPEEDEIRQLMYLKKALAEEPATLISSLETCAENYKVAWDILNKRYDKNWAIISAHLRKIFDDKKVAQMKKTPKTTLDLISLARQHVISLKSLSAANPDLDLFSATLIYLLSTNIDERTKSEWDVFMASKQEPVALDNFFEFIEEHCSCLQEETVEENKPKWFLEAVKSAKKTSKNDPLPAKRSKVDGDGCVLCSGSHRLYNCPEYQSLTVKQRMAALKEHRLCSNCLSPNCRPFKCALPPQCKECEKNHHPTIHFTFFKWWVAKPTFGRPGANNNFRAGSNGNYNQYSSFGSGPVGLPSAPPHRNNYASNPSWLPR